MNDRARIHAFRSKILELELARLEGEPLIVTDPRTEVCWLKS